MTELISALRAETEADSVSPERVGYVLQQIVDALPEASTAINSIKSYVVIESTDDLPSNPSADEQMKGYIHGTTLYVYVGAGGDTLDGKYEGVELQGPQGNPGVSLGEVELVDDLTTGGSDKALSARQGVVLKGLVDAVTDGVAAVTERSGAEFDVAVADRDNSV
ncbi:MAG: hypothetical protein IJU62_03600, partial [Muribaculaceae bacterium]|nr:hypothetical protein [Muribaculaceae bacterium]